MLQIVRSFILTAGLLCFLTPSASASQAEADFLRHAAEQYILAQFTNLPPDVKIEVTAGRVRADKDYGGKCTGYLTAQLQGSEIRENNTVKIVCARPDNPYTVYVPVKAERYIAKLTAARDLPKDTILNEADISRTFVPDARQNSFAINDSHQLIGSKLKRDIRAGGVFAPQSLCVICKGDKVQIVAHKGTLSLKTSGVAMEDGNVDDSIKVQNTRSKKTVIARVLDHSTVLIEL